MIDTNGIGSGPSEFGATPTSSQSKGPANRSSGGAGLTGSYGPATDSSNSSRSGRNDADGSSGGSGPAAMDDPMQPQDRLQSKL
jgi:hypothetical protein